MVIRDAWFCYEKNFAGKYIPVIYYDEPPAKSMNGKENTPDRIQVIKVPEISTETDGEYSLITLQKLYPNLKLLQKESSSVIDKEKEKEMARPVNGYMSSQGQFFDTEAQADLYDATYELTQAATAAVRKEFGDDRSQEDINTIADGIRSFITENERVIREYLDARTAITKDASGDAAGMDRSPTGDNPSDDTSIRGESDTRLEGGEGTEDQSPATGDEPVSGKESDL